MILKSIKDLNSCPQAQHKLLLSSYIPRYPWVFLWSSAISITKSHLLERNLSFRKCLRMLPLLWGNKKEKKEKTTTMHNI